MEEHTPQKRIISIGPPKYNKKINILFPYNRPMVTGGLQNQISTKKNSRQSAHKPIKLRAKSLA